MKGELNKPGKPALRVENLNNGAFSLEEGTRERLLDTFSGGAISDSQMEGETIPFYITGTTLAINVGTGIANAPADDAYFEKVIAIDPPFGCINLTTGGERIVIARYDVGASGAAYSRIESSQGSGVGSGPFLESEDGLGGYVFTPQSTGALGIPLIDNTVNNVWLSYIPQIDPNTFGVHPITGAKIYTKKMDGYEIAVTDNGVSTYPPYTDTRYMKIGAITTSGGTVSSIDQSMMPMAMSRLNRVGIKVDSTKKPSSYADGASETFLDNHINAVGSGTIKPENPHGMLLADFDDYNARNVDHMRAAHAEGVSNVSVNCLACSTYGSFPGHTGLGVAVTLMAAGEYVNIDGYLNTQVYPQTTIYSGDVGYAYFSASDPDGNYYIYLYNDSLGNTTIGKVLTSGSLPSKYFMLAEFSWVSGTPALTLVQDLRSFIHGFTNTDNIRNGAVSSSKLPAGDTGTSQDITTGNGVKTNHIVDQAITTAKIADGAITTSKLNMGNIPYPIRWCVQGEVATAQKVIQALADADLNITRVDIYEDTMSVYGELTIDIKINGTSIFTTKPKILQSTVSNANPGVRIYTTTDVGAAFTNTPLTTVSYGQINPNANQAYKGDRISLDVTQTASVGDGGGNDLLVSLAVA